MSVLAKTRYFWRSAVQGILHAPFVHAVAILTIALTLFLASLVRTGTLLVDSLLTSLGGAVELTTYLTTTSEEEAQALSRQLVARTGGTARVVSREEALARLAQELGEMGGALSELPENPLPLSIELAIPPALRTPAALRALAGELGKLPGVSAVDYGEQAVERLSAIAEALRFGGLIAFLVVAVVTVATVSATLQLAIYARREEIDIQKLVGATNRFVKTPFLIEGVFQGLAGAALAALGLWAFAEGVGPRLAGLFSFLVGPVALPPILAPAALLELGAAGCALGLLGSFVAVGRFLRI